jgi:plastocyanin
MTRRKAAALAASTFLFLFGACGGDDEDAADDATDTTSANGGSSGSDGVAVSVKGFKFNPADITADVGQPIVFTFEDGTAHNVTFDDQKSDDISDGEYEVTFDEAGSYDFQCTIHPQMTGKVEVS